jgi:hypothetical protein
VEKRTSLLILKNEGRKDFNGSLNQHITLNHPQTASYKCLFIMKFFALNESTKYLIFVSSTYSSSHLASGYRRFFIQIKYIS